MPQGQLSARARDLLPGEPQQRTLGGTYNGTSTPGPRAAPIETKHVHVYLPENSRNVVSNDGRNNSNRAQVPTPRSVSRNGS